MQKGLNFLFWLLVLALFASFWLYLQPSQSQLAAAHVATVVSTSRPGTPTPVPSLTPSPTNPPETATAGSPDVPLTDSSLILKWGAGTQDSPLTDKLTILEIINAFAKAETQFLLAQRGWFHVSLEHETEMNQNDMSYHDISIGHLYLPYYFQDSWYHFVDGLSYDQALDRMMSPAGDEMQRSLFINGQWINLTLNELGSSLPETSTLNAQFYPSTTQMLEALTITNEQCQWQGWIEQDNYVVNLVCTEQEPFQLLGFSEAMQGTITTYKFDLETGWLRHNKLVGLTITGETRLVTEVNLLSYHFSNALPEDVEEIFYQSQTQLNGDN